MLTYKGIPLRRIDIAFHQTRTASAVYLIETWEPRKSYTVPATSIGTDEGIDEILRTARFKGGQILEKPDAMV